MRKFNWDFDSSPIPEPSHQALVNYFLHRFEPGGFMTAMLEGDLYSAVGRADHWNQERFCKIAKWIIMNAPRGSFGSKVAVKGWLDGNEYFQQFEKEYLIDILQDTDNGT